MCFLLLRTHDSCDKGLGDIPNESWKLTSSKVISQPCFRSYICPVLSLSHDQDLWPSACDLQQGSQQSPQYVSTSLRGAQSKTPWESWGWTCRPGVWSSCSLVASSYKTILWIYHSSESCLDFVELKCWQIICRPQGSNYNVFICI